MQENAVVEKVLILNFISYLKILSKKAQTLSSMKEKTKKIVFTLNTILVSLYFNKLSLIIFFNALIIMQNKT